MAIAVIAVLAGFTAVAAIPDGYYSSLNGKSGQALKDAIHELAIRHTTLSYGSLWVYSCDKEEQGCLSI